MKKIQTADIMLVKVESFDYDSNAFRFESVGFYEVESHEYSDDDYNWEVIAEEIFNRSEGYELRITFSLPNLFRRDKFSKVAVVECYGREIEVIEKTYSLLKH